jgi:hypothetical protein
LHKLLQIVGGVSAPLPIFVGLAVRSLCIREFAVRWRHLHAFSTIDFEVSPAGA